MLTRHRRRERIVDSHIDLFVRTVRNVRVKKRVCERCAEPERFGRKVVGGYGYSSKGYNILYRIVGLPSMQLLQKEASKQAQMCSLDIVLKSDSSSRQQCDGGWRMVHDARSAYIYLSV